MRARDGEDTEELDIRVEIEAPTADDDIAATTADSDAEVEHILAAAADAATGPSATDGPATKPDLGIPDDPTVLSYLLSGIVQMELPRRQSLLEADTTVERLDGLVALLERELVLLGHRLRYFSPDPRLISGARRS